MKQSPAALGSWTTPADWLAALVYTTGYWRAVMPVVVRELDERWRPLAQQIPQPELRDQALRSLRDKRFHAEGGAVYATHGWSRRSAALAVPIVALQTISDYLDNLCDRAGDGDPEDFRCLHQAMHDAVTPGSMVAGYYRWRPGADDGGYLRGLVERCQAALAALPGYPRVQPAISRLVGLYCDLQVHKHVLPRAEREPRLLAWHRQEWTAGGLAWWEFAAASGSTLAVFALFRLAQQPHPTEATIAATLDAYFPSICALHILLDYFIDQEEDAREGDLNLVSYYQHPAACAEGLRRFLRTGLAAARRLPESRFHAWVVRGLPALYLADGKAADRRLRDVAAAVMAEAGGLARATHRTVRAYRWWERQQRGV